MNYQYKISKDHYKTLRDELSFSYDYSSRLIREIKREGKITLNHKECFLGDAIKSGDLIAVQMPQEKIDAEPMQGRLSIVYEDDELLVVNKPSFCVTHPTKSHQLDTLANYIAHHWECIGSDAKIRFINRLDRDTTGLVAIAKNKYVHYYVQKQMEEKRVEKIYHAFVNGRLKKKAGTINRPIGQPYENSIHRVVMDEGKNCVTHYRVIEEYAQASLVELVLETGRTHQIRVHLHYLGHSIIGDPLYSTSKNERYGMTHQALHARSLKLSLPMKKKLILEAEYNKELNALRNRLENTERKR